MYSVELQRSELAFSWEPLHTSNGDDDRLGAMGWSSPPFTYTFDGGFDNGARPRKIGRDSTTSLQVSGASIQAYYWSTYTRIIVC